MPLSKKEIDGLLRLIGLTQDQEINCEQCLSLIAEFAERKLAGKSIPERLKAVEHHLSASPSVWVWSFIGRCWTQTSYLCACKKLP